MSCPFWCHGMCDLCVLHEHNIVVLYDVIVFPDRRTNTPLMFIFSTFMFSYIGMFI